LTSSIETSLRTNGYLFIYLKKLKERKRKRIKEKLRKHDKEVDAQIPTELN